jgi:hypothetical protein
MRLPTLVRALAIAAIVPMARPALAQVAVLSSTVEEHESAPGGTYAGRIVIANSTQQPQSVRIYQTDYRFTSAGASDFETPGTLPRSNAAWVTPQSQRIVVPPGAEVTVAYSVRVPQIDTLRGTYWSAIMVEGTGTPSADPRAAQGQVGLNAIVRYAVQVATHIGTRGARTVKFFNPTAALSEKGIAALDVDVENTGERGYRPTISAEIYDASGVLRGRGKQVRGLLYPGTSLRQHFEFGTLPAGEYKLVVYADTGDDTVIATQFAVKY